jgi:hypothetical protein
MPVTRTWLRTLIFTASLLAGCSPAVSTNPDDYVGEYVFMPANSNPEESASFVILKRDHTAVEVRFYPATGEVSTTKNKWDLYRTTSENVGIGEREYPIKLSGSQIKLLINDDLGQYYQKVR